MNTNKVVLILFGALFAQGSAAAESLPAFATADRAIVTTERGPVRGVMTETLRAFLGIPYAAPPVGKLRWRPPEDHALWFRPLDASRFANHCPQQASVFGTASVTEDCLYLNVFTPRPSEEANRSRTYPVMVWIHGGAWTVGESDDYMPTKLVQQGVIIVTINYRLGALGFLAHPALSAESPDHISGNYGLMDQQFALKWVQRNIAALGGDPENVTIFGESAGGRSVLMHMASPSAATLFHRGIIESGAYFGLNTPTLADEESHGENFAASIGCSNQSARCLRSKSVKKLLANWGLFDSSTNVDGKILPESPDTAFVTGQFNHVPLIHGANHDEWRFFVALSFDLSGAPITPDDYPSVVESMVGPDVAPLVLAEYPLDNYDSPDLAVGAIGSDSIFTCPARAVDQVLSAQVPTFAYEFNDTNAPELFLPPVSFPYGATHGSELRYLFDLTWGGQLDGQQEELSGAMLRYWTQFANSGDPNSSGLPFWRQYDVTTDEFQSLVPPTPMTNFGFSTDHKCDFWGNLFGVNTQRARGN
ncbi:MAG TPA: carboxylesterase family protein [Terriglobales bacterium]|nr:carboxylesterase family protein [Terriglobales bacterium]